MTKTPILIEQPPKQSNNTKTSHIKIDSDLGMLVGVTIVAQLFWLTGKTYESNHPGTFQK